MTFTASYRLNKSLKKANCVVFNNVIRNKYLTVIILNLYLRKITSVW